MFSFMIIFGQIIIPDFPVETNYDWSSQVNKIFFLKFNGKSLWTTIKSKFLKKVSFNLNTGSWSKRE